jgi:hypothetical protein
MPSSKPRKEQTLPQGKNQNQEKRKKKKSSKPTKRVYNFQGPIKRLFRKNLEKNLGSKKIDFSDKGMEGKYDQLATTFLNDIVEDIRKLYPSTDPTGKKKEIKIKDITMLFKVSKKFRSSQKELIEGGEGSVQGHLARQLERAQENSGKPKRGPRKEKGSSKTNGNKGGEKEKEKRKKHSSSESSVPKKKSSKKHTEQRNQEEEEQQQDEGQVHKHVGEGEESQIQQAQTPLDKEMEDMEVVVNN